MLAGLLGILLFLATCLGIAGGLIGIAIDILARRIVRAGKIALFLLGWILLYAAALLGSSLASRPRFLPPRQERCFDEMCFSLKGVAVASRLGTQPVSPQAAGEFYVVTVQLRSDSRRTAQKPSQPELFVIDAEGKRYPRMVSAGEELGLPAGQPVTAAQLWDQRIRPGETVLLTVAFDLPLNIPQPALVVNEGIGPLSAVIIGDENSFFHARTAWLLIRDR